MPKDGAMRELMMSLTFLRAPAATATMLFGRALQGELAGQGGVLDPRPAELGEGRSERLEEVGAETAGASHPGADRRRTTPR